jgi:hypothetical protein
MTDKADTKPVKATLTQKQVESIDSLIGDLGSNRQDVVGKILTMWLYQENVIQEDE